MMSYKKKIKAGTAQITLQDIHNSLYFQYQTEKLPWCIFGSNLVILAQICDKLSSEQDNCYRHMDT